MALECDRRINLLMGASLLALAKSVYISHGINYLLNSKI